MKYPKRFLITILCGLFTIMTGCSNPSSKQDGPSSPVLEQIEITKNPLKTEYLVGAKDFDVSGMVVTAIYSNGNKKDVTSRVATSGFDSLEAQLNQPITVTYKSKTAVFYINIVNVVLQKITIKSEPLKKEYSVGDKIDLTGLKVIAEYDDGMKADVTDKITVSGFNSSSVNDSQTIAITYNKKTATFDIKISAVVVEKIEITTPPLRKNYLSGDELDLTGLVVTATYTDGSTRVLLPSEYTVTGFDSIKGKEIQTVIVTNNGKTATFEVNVKIVGNLYVQEEPTKREYFTGNNLELNGLRIIAIYTDCSFEEITPELKVSGFDSRIPVEEQTITLSYGGKSWSYTIKIKQGTYTFHDTVTVLPAGTNGTAGTDATYVEFGDWPQKVISEKDAEVLGLWESNVKVYRGGMPFTQGKDGNYYVMSPENQKEKYIKYSDGTLVGKDGESNRWFKVMPIKWRVLDTEYKDASGTVKGKLLFAEDALIANQPFYNYKNVWYKRTVGTKTEILPNNYEFSQIRAYLNGTKYYRDEDDQTVEDSYEDYGFLQIAFGESGQALIETVEVDNSPASTIDVNGKYSPATAFACGNTNDKIFLLSEYEATKYFNPDPDLDDERRIRVPTDYAKANYCYISVFANWGVSCILRSPYVKYADGNGMYILHYSGSPFMGLETTRRYLGVVPALVVNY